MADAGPRAAARPIGVEEAKRLLQPRFAGTSGILLAVSGGPDSMALLAMAASLEHRPPLAVATVDHGLRDGSAAEADLVAAQSATLGLPHATLRWDSPKPGAGLQEAAREARYALLADEARRHGFSHLATAHHADDQAETVLMRLAAGSGITGLAGMRECTSRHGLVLVRPLLGVAKARLVATCEALALDFVRDPSNANPRFGRSRVRAALEALAGEGLAGQRLNRLAARAARADEALTLVADRALAEAGLDGQASSVQADWSKLAAQPAEIRLRALAALIRHGCDDRLPVRLERLEALLAALDAAAEQGLGLRRSIGGRIATLRPDGRIMLADAPPRRRGRMTSGILLE